jgi:UDP-GlcNAc:undecaprenyl-phosphate/decaprenyl-phosphate GlcNAc-1-phosphate transferase
MENGMKRFKWLGARRAPVPSIMVPSLTRSLKRRSRPRSVYLGGPSAAASGPLFEIFQRRIYMRVLNIFAIFATIGCAWAQESSELKTQQDKINYGIGVGVARNFKAQGLNVDLELVIRGMRDTLSGATLLMTEEDLAKTMYAFQQEVQQKQAQARKLAAEKNKKEGEAFLAENAKKEGVTVLPSGLQYKILKTGDGKIPGNTDSVECHYRGTFIDGKEFDNSYKMGKPLIFKIQGGIIPGWSEALKLMPVGSKWQVFLPPQLAYGENGAGSQIGPNVPLIFEIELLSIK